MDRQQPGDGPDRCRPLDGPGDSVAGQYPGQRRGHGAGDIRARGGAARRRELHRVAHPASAQPDQQQLLYLCHYRLRQCGCRIARCRQQCRPHRGAHPDHDAPVRGSGGDFRRARDGDGHQRRRLEPHVDGGKPGDRGDKPAGVDRPRVPFQERERIEPDYRALQRVSPGQSGGGRGVFAHGGIVAAAGDRGRVLCFCDDGDQRALRVRAEREQHGAQRGDGVGDICAAAAGGFAAHGGHGAGERG